MAFCNGCGAPLTENARFCIKCGESVFSESEDMTGDMAVNLYAVDEKSAGQEESAATIDNSPLPEEPVPGKKAKTAIVFSVIILVLVLLLLGGGGWYLMKVSSPDRVVADFAQVMGNGKYALAHNYLEMDDRNPRVKNLDGRDDFVNWQKTLDIKEGAITSVDMQQIVIYDRGWGSAEANGRAILEVKRGSKKQEIHLHLKSKPSKILGFIPNWQLVYPSTVIDFSKAGLFEGTDIYMDGVKVMVKGDVKPEHLKVETYAGNHLVTFNTALSQPVEVFPAGDLDGVKNTDFIIKPEEQEAIKQAVTDSVQIEDKFWANQGKDLSILVNISANGASYPGAIKSMTDSFMETFDEDLQCKNIRRPTTVSNIYDIEITAADTVGCKMDAFYTLQVNYIEKEYDWYSDDYIEYERSWDDSGYYTSTYKLTKEGEEWKVYSKD